MDYMKLFYEDKHFRDRAILFASKEFNTENLEFLRDYNDFIKLPVKEKEENYRGLYRRFYAQYLKTSQETLGDDGAPKQLNLADFRGQEETPDSLLRKPEQGEGALTLKQVESMLKSIAEHIEMLVSHNQILQRFVKDLKEKVEESIVQINKILDDKIKEKETGTNFLPNFLTSDATLSKNKLREKLVAYKDNFNKHQGDLKVSKNLLESFSNMLQKMYGEVSGAFGDMIEALPKDSKSKEALLEEWKNLKKRFDEEGEKYGLRLTTPIKTGALEEEDITRINRARTAFTNRRPPSRL